ncbi:choice-of-anchor M domain-containing protein [Gardnerella vaginalis]|uniref:choice-of-anchor M domain-containing protein n=1 Tax=Gardnerella vaginalis TaxID=2702 RepID=UPI000352AB25|nr:choice-of-anchor M domain-containing protein [Gardnerella vaginalis]EPI56341.1 putative ABC transporter-associated repeat protein [Gardnerella vaginalis JCP7275]
MRNKSTLICFRLLSAILSAIISFGFLASMCCCNCGSAYASEAAQEESAEQNGQDAPGEQEDSSTVSNQNAGDKNEYSSQAENETACKNAVVDKDSSKPKDSDTRYEKCKVYKGHTDGIAVYMDKSGHLVLGTQGDYFPGVPKNGVRYNSDRIEFMLGSNTKLKKSDFAKELSFLPKDNSGEYVWALPQGQEDNKLWLGFTTQTLPRKTVSAVKFRLKSANIPEGGAVYVYENDSHGKVIPVLGSPNTDFPHKFYRNDNTHLHVNWVFTKPGQYGLCIEVTVKTKDGKILKDSQGYTFNVDMQDGASVPYFRIEDKDPDDDGELNKHENQNTNESDEDGDDSDNEDEESEDNEDEDDEDSSTSIVINGNNNRVYVTPWPGAKPNGGLANQSSDEEDGNGKSEGGNGSETESGSEAESKGKNKKQKTVKKCSKFKDLQGDKLVIKHGHVDLATYSTGNGIGFAVQEDVTGSHVKRDPSKVVFYAGKSAKDKGVWRLPQTQKNSVPWVGWSNQNLSPHKPSKISLKSVKGPGSVRIWLQGGLGVKAKTLMSSSGNSTYTIPANTHMHLNWDFSKSGYYTITFAVSANGKTVTKDFHFAIGVDPMEKPMSCSMTKVDDEDGDSDDKSNETDEDEDSENNSDDEDKQNNNKNNKDNNNNNDNDNDNSGNNSGATPLAAAARGNSGSGASFFGGGIGASKSANRGKTGRSVSLSGGIGNHANKGIQSKYNSKRVKGLRKSLQSGVKSEEPRGIVGLFKHKPVVAYTALSLGITAISGTCAAGLFILRKRGLIPAGGLFRALMNLK